MQDSDTPIPEEVLKQIEKEAEEAAAEEQQIREEADKLVAEAEAEEKALLEEVERLTEENPNLVFEQDPNLIGDGVHISPDVIRWALAHGAFGKPKGFKSQYTKKRVTEAKRKSRRKLQKKSRKANRR